MESTLLHIEYLIQRHDCVILPGIGALISTRRAARYVEEEGVFIPPTRQICFNSAVCKDDGLLVDSIRRRGRMGFEDARRQMVREIQALKSHLDRDGEVTLGKIGLLQKDEEGKISFRPMQSAEETMADMGMERISLRDLEAGSPDSSATSQPIIPADRQKTASSTSQPASTEYTLPEEAAANDTDTIEIPTAEGPREHDQWIPRRRGYYYLSIKKAVGNIAAAVILALGITGALLAPKAEPRQEAVEASVVPVKELMEAGVKRKPPTQSQTRQTPSESYRLIVGSFKTEDEAREYIGQHEESSYGLEITHTGKMWLVTAASSSDRETLLSLSRDESFRQEFSQSWIWRERK